MYPYRILSICYTVRKEIDLLKYKYLKPELYINKPQSLRALKTNIRREIRKILTEILQKVIENAKNGLSFASQQNGDIYETLFFLIDL